MEAAQMLYDKNLAMLMDKVRTNRRDMYRVMMDCNGLIVSITSCRASKPQENCFTLFVPGEGKVPRFGTLNKLSQIQSGIATFLLKDMLKLVKVSEVAYVLKSSTESPVLEHKVQVLTERFGLLPEPAIKKKDDEVKIRRLRQQQQEEEKQQILDEFPESIFENLLAEELALEAKRKNATA